MIKVGWNGFDVYKLARVATSPFSSAISLRYPAMNNFHGLGFTATMWGMYGAFAIDPGNPNHLIAADIIQKKIMQTTDGGDNWAEIPQLTSLVTDGGRFAFHVEIKSQISAISFNPDFPNMVALGTLQNGVFISGDSGATWTKIPGSESVTFIAPSTRQVDSGFSAGAGIPI